MCGTDTTLWVFSAQMQQSHNILLVLQAEQLQEVRTQCTQFAALTTVQHTHMQGQPVCQEVSITQI